MENYDPNYVVGRGRLFFDAFIPGTRNSANGELYLGNTPAFNLNQDETTLDHYSSESGMREKDESVILTSDLAGSFDADDINLDNVALFFYGERLSMVNVGETGIEETHVVRRGRWIQLGVNVAEGVSGARHITNVEASIDGTSVALLGNIDVDVEKGRVYIEPGSEVIEDGVEIEFTYDIEAHSRDIVISKGQQVRGRLRFLADNAHGENKDYFLPNVRLISNGDYALKGDEWQTMSFSFEALSPGYGQPRLIVDGPSVAVGDDNGNGGD